MTNPFDTAPDTARLLAQITDYVPTVLLEAAARALTRQARAALTDVNQHPGRRGNPAKRERAHHDEELSQQLLRATLARPETPALPPSTPEDTDTLQQLLATLPPDQAAGAPPGPDATAHPTDEGLDLGPEQWKVAATIARTWQGTPNELYRAAKAIIPGERAIELDSWLQERRRQQARAAIVKTHSQVTQHTTYARLDVEEIARITRRVHESNQEAERLMELLSIQTAAAYLSDTKLAAYQRAIHAGLTPEDALFFARTQPEPPSP